VLPRDPFRIHGWVVLPEHLHCVIELPPGETDFAVRWRIIKMRRTRASYEPLDARTTTCHSSDASHSALNEGGIYANSFHRSHPFEEQDPADLLLQGGPISHRPPLRSFGLRPQP